MKDIDLYNGYDQESFAVVDGAVDENVTPTHVDLRIIGSVYIDTDEDITVKFNATTEPGIPLTSANAPLTMDNILITSILVTNASGSTATVSVVVTGIKAL